MRQEHEHSTGLVRKARRPASFTPREDEILQLIWNGYQNRQIALNDVTLRLEPGFAGARSLKTTVEAQLEEAGEAVTAPKVAVDIDQKLMSPAGRSE